MNKNDYITKEYLDNTLDKRFADFGNEIKQYMKDLRVGFTEDLGIVMDQLKSLSDKVESLDSKVESLDNKVVLLDDKVDRIDKRLVGVENNLTKVECRLSNLEIDVKEIKKTLPNYVEKKQFNKLDKRLKVLEGSRIVKTA